MLIDIAAEDQHPKEVLNDEQYELLDFDDEMGVTQVGASPLSSLGSSPVATSSTHKDDANNRLSPVDQTPSKRKRVGGSAQTKVSSAANEEDGMEETVATPTRRARRTTMRSTAGKR